MTAIGQWVMRWIVLPLGKAVSEEALEEVRVNPMTLEERLWEKLEWERPENETCSCWWISNYNEPDKTQPCRLICRSLTGLRLELEASRCATTQKLRREWERRLETNARAADSLHDNAQPWNGRPQQCTKGNLSLARASGEVKDGIMDT